MFFQIHFSMYFFIFSLASLLTSFNSFSTIFSNLALLFNKLLYASAISYHVPLLLSVSPSSSRFLSTFFQHVQFGYVLIKFSILFLGRSLIPAPAPLQLCYLPVFNIRFSSFYKLSNCFFSLSTSCKILESFLIFCLGPSPPKYRY